MARLVSVEVEIVGNGKYGGSRSSITSYNVTEDSTPLDPADSSGGTGTITFGAKEDPAHDGSILLLNDIINLSDTGSGTTTGKVNGVSASNGVAMVTADGRLNLLNSAGDIPAVDGTLDEAVHEILGLAGITTGIFVDASLQGIPVKSRGGNKNYWFMLKEMCSALQVEIALVSNNVVVRPPRERTAFMGKITSESHSVKNIELAQFVEVAYYNYTQVSSSMVYPYGGWNSDVSVYQVDAGETRTINLPVDVALSALSQPTMVSSVSQYYSGPTSVYAIAGNDGLPISPALWASGGGALTLAIGEDGESIDVTVTGMSEPGYAPYQIAMSSGASNYYSSLRIMGTGLGFRRELIRVPTGAPAEKTSQEVGVTIDNPWVNTKGDAYAAAFRAGGRYASPQQSVEISATFINRAGESGSYVYPTFADFNPTVSGATFATFDSGWVGQSFSDFNDYQFSLVQGDFTNQVFGNVGGARIPFRQAVYRIRSATISQNGITTATAESDTLFSDFNPAWVGEDFASFNSWFAGYKFEDFAVIPLAIPVIIIVIWTNLFTNPSFETDAPPPELVAVSGSVGLYDLTDPTLTPDPTYVGLYTIGTV